MKLIFRILFSSLVLINSNIYANNYSEQVSLVRNNFSISASNRNASVKQPTQLPSFRISELKEYANDIAVPFISNGDSVKCWLPYNCQLIPVFKISSIAGNKIRVKTDNTPFNKQFEYITKAGLQQIELPQWYTGHFVYYYFPKGTEVLELKYRETGYNTEVKGKFECDNEMFNTLWLKAQRTIYLSMRDVIMDNPDNQRVCNYNYLPIQCEQILYTFDLQSHALVLKSIKELTDWSNLSQSTDNNTVILFNTLTIVTYFSHVADTQLINEVYPKIKKQIEGLTLNSDGMLESFDKEWVIENFGKDIDYELFINCLYSIFLQNAATMAHVVKNKGDEASFTKKNTALAQKLNTHYWVGNSYKSSKQEHADEISNALCIIASVADSLKSQEIDKWIGIKNSNYPLAEKFVLEALLKSGNTTTFQSRLNSQYAYFVNSSHTTIYRQNAENKNIVYQSVLGYPLVLLSSYVAGIQPSEAGFSTIEITPHIGDLKNVRSSLETINGRVYVDINISGNSLVMMLDIPQKSEAVVAIPKLAKPYAMILLENKTIYKDKAFIVTDENLNYIGEDSKYCYIRIKSGNWRFEGISK